MFSSMNGSLIYAKYQELISTFPKSITPEFLDKFCQDETVQPFLKWFQKNVKCHNLLTNECTKLRKHIKDNDTWYVDEELDIELAKATKDCPELMKLIDSDYWNSNQSFTDYTIDKDLYDSDLEYLQLIENSTRKLKEHEDQANNNLDKELDALREEEIKVKYKNENCISIIEKFDSCHRQLHEDVTHLANTYTGAIQKKGESFIWTQMPVELYIKQIQTYSDYLNSYAKRQCSISRKNSNEIHETDSSFASEKKENEKFIDFHKCLKTLLTSKVNEVISNVERKAITGLINYIIETYNNGNLKVPSTPVLARAEIAELMKTVDFLEENISILQEQKLIEVMEQYLKTKFIYVLKDEAVARIERRSNKLYKFERLRTLYKEYGLAFSYILCMLFELQIHQINEVVQFVLDARHYLSMEYSSSTARNESMLKLQNEYNSILTNPKEQNAFSRILIEMAALPESKCDLQSTIQYFEGLKQDNSDKINILLKERLDEMIDSSENLETKVMHLYKEAVSKSPTCSFSAESQHIQLELNKAVKEIQQLSASIEIVRNKLKAFTKETSTPNYEREKLLIWQKFLGDPEYLVQRYKELEDIRNQMIV